MALSGAMAAVVVPAVFLLPGCSGGSGGGIVNPTSAPSNLVTNAPVTFSASQTGSLTLNRNGNDVTGTLTVNPVTALKVRGAQIFTFTIPAGVYTVTGSYNEATRTVTLNGTFPAPVGAFNYTGTIPTATQPGSYTITAGGQTVTGTLPATGTVTPVPSGTPVVTPTTPGSTNITGTLTYSDVSATYNGSSPTALTNGQGGFAKQSSASGFALALAANFDNKPTHVRGLTITITKTTDFKAGDTFTLGSVSASGLCTSTLLDFNPTTFEGPTFLANSGSLRIDSISATSLKVTLTNAEYKGTIGTLPQGTGSFKLNGSLTYPAS